MSKFKVGDKVKVVKKGRGEHSERIPDEFENSWVSPMDDAFEKQFIVKSVGYNGVYFEDCVCGMGFPPAALELVKAKQEEKTEETVNLFKIGDKVCLVHPELAEEKYAEPSFFPGEGTVREVSEEDADWPWIRIDGSSVFWPTSALDLVKEEAKVEAKEDKVEKYTVAEVFEALNEVGQMDIIYMAGEIEAFLKKKQDPEWEEFQRLKKKFEG